MIKHVVAICSNDTYIQRAINTIDQLRNKGDYSGDILLFYDNEFTNTNVLEDIKTKYNVILKQFPTLDLSHYITFIKNESTDKYPKHNKLFQFHKLYLFDLFFKKWDRILYIDVGMHIYNNIDRLLNINPTDKLMAHSNCYPSHYGIWKLSHEFQLETDLEIVNDLKNFCNLDLDDHFQSGLLLFNSSIIENDTFDNLYTLLNQYAPLIKYNDQTIFNLYFISIKNIWKPLPIRDSYGLLYDYWERGGCNYNEYIILKEPLTDPNRFYISDLWQ